MKKSSRKIQRDIHQEVTDKIISALEAGYDPWQCPWQDGGSLPCNGKTGANYSGTNTVLLMIERMINGYQSNEWYTFNQMKELGGKLLPKQKGTMAVFFKRRVIKDTDDKGEEEDRLIPMIKHFHVFNKDQIEGLPETEVDKLLDQEEPRFDFAPAERLIEASGAVIEVSGASACYRPSLDTIHMPDRQRFQGLDAEGHWYSTLLHELSHWTGHSTRLARPGITQRGNRKSYAYEEIVVEQASMMLCATLGIKGKLRHESYIASWLTELRNDKKFIFKAASEAQKVTNYLLEKADMMETQETNVA